MKTIIALTILLVAASAAVVPDWKNCGAANAIWVPVNLTLEKPIAHNEPNYISGCGNVTQAFTTNAFNVAAKEFGVSVVDKNRTMEAKTFQANELYCLNYNFTIPSYVIGSFALSFSPIDDKGNVLGCLELDASLLF
jgi:hypothetical protein